jgi:hypothetical protein
MNIRQLFINIAAFVGMVFLFSNMGYNFLTWQYWAMLGLLLTIQINSAID